MTGTNNTPAGWYPAPDQPGNERYWDGSQWSDAYRPAGGAPPPAAPPGGTGWAPQATPPMGAYGAVPGQAYGPAPDNYLVWAILSTLFCCLPFGIVAIVKSTQVNNLWQQGRTTEAQQAAASAKQWAWISAGVGIAVSVVYFLVVVSVETSSSGF